MFGKISRPVIGFLTGSFVSGSQARVMNAAMSTRTPLDCSIRSPRVTKSYEVGGVGLGILMVLEKSNEDGTKIQVTRAFCTRNMNWSKPIPVNSARIGGGLAELDNLGVYTSVNHHGFKQSRAGVYCDGGEYGRSGHHRNEFERRRASRFGEVTAYPTSDFLSACHLCQKNLHGKDIYMYRGEKAFCSTECRYSQIMIDECREKCRSKASRSADVPNSTYSNGHIFSTGILAI